MFKWFWTVISLGAPVLPPQRKRQMRTRSHNYILPVMSGQVVFNQFSNRCLFNTNWYLFSCFPHVFFRFPLFILLPCKLLHVCLCNELLIKTFIIITLIWLVIWLKKKRGKPPPTESVECRDNAIFYTSVSKRLHDQFNSWMTFHACRSSFEILWIASFL